MRHVYFGSVLSRPLIIFHDFLNHLAIGSNPAHTDDETNTRSENYESIGAGGGGPWTNDMTSHTRHDDNWPTWSRPWCCQTRCRPPRKKGGNWKIREWGINDNKRERNRIGQLYLTGEGGKEKSERSTERKIPPTTETRSRPFARPIPLSDLVCMYVSVRVASTQRCGRACHYPPVSAGHPIRKASCWVVVVGGIVTIHTLARTCLITEPAAHAAGRGGGNEKITK